jgi:hypothetical protein
VVIWERRFPVFRLGVMIPLIAVAVWQLCIGKQLRFGDRGHVQLKGLPEPTIVYRRGVAPRSVGPGWPFRCGNGVPRSRSTVTSQIPLGVAFLEPRS